MPDLRWRTSNGILATFLWSLVIGGPVLLFHLRHVGMDALDHAHAFVLFVASQVLVFWWAARPGRTTTRTTLVGKLLSLTKRDEVPSAYRVWEAEVVPDTARSRSWETASAFAPPPPRPQASGFVVQLTVGNYLGSSHVRQVQIEPGGGRVTLQPGQELSISARGIDQPPRIRCVESDLATQVYFDGIALDVTCQVVGGVDPVPDPNQAFSA
jgi:hypothetical protein